jgi:PAS domain S-box-containing protein
MKDQDSQHLAAIVRGSDDAIIGKSLDGIITSWNFGAQSIFGYTPDEAIGRTIAILVPPDRQDELPDILEKLARGERLTHYETLRVTKDGRLVNMSITISPIRDNLGIIIGASSIGRDVTKEKEAEAALRESARAYKLLMEQASDAILVSYPDQPLIDVNQRASDMLGYSREELLQLRGENNALPEGLSALSLRPEEFQDGDTVYSERVVRRKDGTTIVTELSTRQLDDRRILTIARDITYRKRAEESLRESEAQLRSAIDIAQLSTYEWNSHTDVLTWDPGMKDIWGLPHDTSVDNDIFLAGIHPDDRDYVQEQIAQSHNRADGGLFMAEYRVIGQQDKQERWVAVHGRTFFEGDTAVRQVGVAQDITERRRAEEALKERTEQLRVAQRLAQLGSWQWDIRNDKVDWSDELFLLFGVGPQQFEATFEAYMGFVHPEDKERVGKDIEQALQEKSSFTHETRVVKLDGTIWHLQARGEAVLDEAGNVIGMLGTAQDITERKRAEEALRASEQKFRAIFENTLEAVFITDDKGTFVDVNHAATTLAGLPAWELVGRNYMEIQSWKPTAQLLLLQDQVAEGDEANGDLQFVSANGEIRDIEYFSKLNFIPGYNLSVAHDHTERRRTEEARLARYAAERANHAKSEFLSRMSHELRTPLNAILGFGQLLQMDSPTPEQAESVGYILKAGQHLLVLINEVLDIARIEDGKIDFSIEPVSVRDVLQESLHLVQPMAAHRNIEMKADLAAMNNCYVMADHQRLQQVLMNLLANAIKYNREGGAVNVSCSASSCNADGLNPQDTMQRSRVRIAVSDTGPGLAPGDVGRLFTPFERLGAEQSDVEGTGLGLALCKHLVEAMRGVIGVDSEQGAGSTFWVELAPAVEHLPVDDLLVTGSLLDIQLREQIHTILYIEDNLSNLRLIERILGKRPEVNLITAMQGQMGLDMAFEHMPDLILLDLHLPDITGDEVLRRLREDYRTVSIPVVVLSADASPRQADKLLEAGAQAYLTKPIDVGQLLKVLGETTAPRKA